MSFVPTENNFVQPLAAKYNPTNHNNMSLDEYKLSCELFGHSLDVRAVTEGRIGTIVSGSRDMTAKVWTAEG